MFFSGEVENAGVAGDMFGAANALFSGLAFACLILALRMQREELSLQRQELKDTRDEFAKQTKIQDAHLELLTSERKEREELQKLSFQPRLMLRCRNKYSNVVTMNLINAGAAIYDLKVSEPTSTLGTPSSLQISDDTILDRGESVIVTMFLEGHSYHKLADYSFCLNYATDTDGDQSRTLKIRIGVGEQEPTAGVW
jgi:hypothetical protein